jgi:hypothetical protein
MTWCARLASDRRVSRTDVHGVVGGTVPARAGDSREAVEPVIIRMLCASDIRTVVYGI